MSELHPLDMLVIRSCKDNINNKFRLKRLRRLLGLRCGFSFDNNLSEHDEAICHWLIEILSLREGGFDSWWDVITDSQKFPCFDEKYSFWTSFILSLSYKIRWSCKDSWQSMRWSLKINKLCNQT